MNAAQMEKEFEIAYESIASNGAPGYEPFEKSILLTQAQNDIIKELVTSGAEKDDVRALVIGPHIKTEAVTDPTEVTYINPGYEDVTSGSEYLTFSWDGVSKTTISVYTEAPDYVVFDAQGSGLAVEAGDTITLTSSNVTGSLSVTDQSSINVVLNGVLFHTWLDYTDLTSGYDIDITASGTLLIWVRTYTNLDTTLEYDLEIAHLPVLRKRASAMYPTGITFEHDMSDIWLIVNERIKETSSSTPIEVKPVEHTFLDANINNPFKKPQTGRHFWRVLQYGENTDLFTTANFVVVGLSDFDTYYINYLEKPTPIIVPATSGTIDGVTAGADVDVDGIGTGINITTSGLDCAFNSLIHRDIVKRAAQLGAAYVSDTESFQLLMNSYNRT